MFYPEIPLDAEQLHAIARGLYTIARSDGLHQQELDLIQTLWDGPGVLVPIAPELLATILRSADERLLFMKLGLMLARVQGNVTQPERQILGRYAQAFELTGADLLGLEMELVKEMEAELAA